MLISLSINPAKTTKDITNFIKQTVKNAGFSRLVVGLSGGLDSSVSCTLAVKALGAENVFVSLMPYGDFDKEGLENAKLIFEKLNIPSSNIQLIDIKNMVDCIADEIKTPRQGRGGGISEDSNVARLRKGNIIVRLRMILLYDFAKKHRVLVLGTENKTEHLLGYFTRFGDSASDIEPIRHLYKTQVRLLAEYLSIPGKIINKPPSAGMWRGQTDEKEFGFSYKKADRVLYLYIDQEKPKEEIKKYGFREEEIEKIIERIKNNEFKHKTPYLALS